jgi:hypothetical protein
LIETNFADQGGGYSKTNLRIWVASLAAAPDHPQAGKRKKRVRFFGNGRDNTGAGDGRLSFGLTQQIAGDPKEAMVGYPADWMQ